MIRSLSIAAMMFLLSACGKPEAGDHAHDGGAAQSDHGDEATGAHGGRLLAQSGYAVELKIAEDGTPPRLQAWLYRDGKPLPPQSGTIEVRLQRLGGASEVHRLVAQPDGSLRAATEVAEPHSFDVQVNARVQDRPLTWTYESYEGRTTINAEAARDVGLRVMPVGPGTIADAHEVQGLLTSVEGRAASITARFPGPIRRVAVNVGDTVRAGQTLATVESNLSLTTYPVTSPIAGVVLARQASVGAMAGEGAVLFEVADLSTLWVDLHIFGADAQHITAGVPVTITRMSDGVTAETTLERVLPGTATASQSTVARATLTNRDGLWRPGSAVKARITVDRTPAARVVPLSALQTLGGRDVVFVRVGDIHEARPVTLGKRDATQVEILSGLQEGQSVVIEQSYVVKADIEKSGASHEH